MISFVWYLNKKPIWMCVNGCLYSSICVLCDICKMYFTQKRYPCHVVILFRFFKRGDRVLHQLELLPLELISEYLRKFSSYLVMNTNVKQIWIESIWSDIGMYYMCIYVKSQYLFQCDVIQIPFRYILGVTYGKFYLRISFI